SHHITAQHSTAQHSTAKHSIAQHSTAHHSTVQYSIAEPSTAAYIHCLANTSFLMYMGVKSILHKRACACFISVLAVAQLFFFLHVQNCLLSHVFHQCFGNTHMYVFAVEIKPLCV